MSYNKCSSCERKIEGCRYPSRWESFDRISEHHRLPLPPPFLPLRRTPSFCSFSEHIPGHIPQHIPYLRRWDNSLAVNQLARRPEPVPTSVFARPRGQPRYRSEIGSMLQLPTAQSYFSPPERVPSWHYSCRNVSQANNSLVCVFCKSNREPPEVYSSHTIRVNGRVTCPVLRRYVCRFCQATGDDAHTDSYCPSNPNRGFRSSMKSVLKTPFMSSGKKRSDNLGKQQ